MFDYATGKLKQEIEETIIGMTREYRDALVFSEAMTAYFRSLVDDGKANLVHGYARNCMWIDVLLLTSSNHTFNLTFRLDRNSDLSRSFFALQKPPTVTDTPRDDSSFFVEPEDAVRAYDSAMKALRIS
jgi:hypothetical protein